MRRYGGPTSPPPSLLPRRPIALLITVLTSAALLTGCAGVAGPWTLSRLDGPARADVPSAFQPAGPAAAQIELLWWVMFWLGTVIYIIVMAYLLWALFRRRRSANDALTPGQEQNVVVWGGAIIPGVVVLGLFGLTVALMRSISTPSPGEAVTIYVTGHQWWWEVNYPELQINTANEIHIPVGQRIEFHLTSDDVIHSFWVPQLHGKLDLNPGRVTNFHLVADEPGVYWGECAEFCGVQHAKMRFLIVAHPPEVFEEWVAVMTEPMEVPTEPLAIQGLEVFLSSNCVYCHKIEGTEATGDLGPDLTHLALRRTLGAGTIENSPGNLGGWIADPHGVKSGVLMPPSDLSGEELNALIHFLGTLD